MQTRMFYRILQGDEMISAKMLKRHPFKTTVEA